MLDLNVLLYIAGHGEYKSTGKAAFGMGATDYVQTQPIARHMHTDRPDKQEGQGSTAFF